MRGLKFVLMVIGALTCLALAGYGALYAVKSWIAGEGSGETLETKVSPDGAVTARIDRWNGGAGTSYRYIVYLMSAETGTETEVFRGSRLDNLHLNWKSNDILLLGMSCGNVLNFRNDFYRDERLEKRVDILLDAPGHCPGR